MNIKEYHDNRLGKSVKEHISFTDSLEDDRLLQKVVEYFTQRQKEGANIPEESPYNILKEKSDQELFVYQTDDHVLVVDCETDGLYGDFLSVGIIVVDADKKIKDVLYLYQEEVKASQRWVKENVLHKLKATTTELQGVLKTKFEPTVISVSSQEELFTKTAELLKGYRGSKVYAEHLFPVEWRFFRHEKLAQLKLKLIEVAPEAESYFEEKEKEHQHKAWFDAYKTYQAISWKKAPYSSHVFVLPFVIQGKTGELKIDQNSWEEINYSKLESSGFPYFDQKYYKIEEDGEKAKNYLNYAYNRFFNDEFLEVVGKKCQTYLYKNPNKKDYYQIIVGKKNNEEDEFDIYHLDLDYVLLRFLDDSQKLGFLIISCQNKKYPLTSQIMTINQYGRRMYHPFLRDDISQAESALDIRLVRESEKDVQKDEVLPPHFDAKKKQPYQAISELVQSIFGEEKLCLFNGEKNAHRPLHTQRPLFDSIIDDRMFVISNYHLSRYHYGLLADGLLGEGNEAFFKYLPKEGSAKAIYEQQKQLYAYTYVDKSYASYQSPIKIRTLLEDSIYERWLDYGTMYGITQHSMMMFNQGPGAPNYLFAYFYSEYMELVLFVLAQRMKILDFSFRAGEIAEAIKGSSKERPDVETSLDLQKDYVVFKNQYLLAEISPQEQAVDLYRMLQKNLYVAEQKELLDDQIQSLYEISVSLDAKEEQKSTRLLNSVAIGLAVLTMVTGFNDFKGVIDALRQTAISVVENTGEYSVILAIILYFLLIYIILFDILEFPRPLRKILRNVRYRDEDKS